MFYHIIITKKVTIKFKYRVSLYKFHQPSFVFLVNFKYKSNKQNNND